MKSKAFQCVGRSSIHEVGAEAGEMMQGIGVAMKAVLLLLPIMFVPLFVCLFAIIIAIVIVIVIALCY